MKHFKWKKATAIMLAVTLALPAAPSINRVQASEQEETTMLTESSEPETQTQAESQAAEIPADTQTESSAPETEQPPDSQPESTAPETELPSESEVLSEVLPETETTESELLVENDELEMVELTDGTDTESVQSEDLADNSVSESVKAVQALIEELPAVEELSAMSIEEQQKVYEKVQTGYDAYAALSDEEKALIAGAEIFEKLFDFFNRGISTLADTVYISSAADLKNFRDRVNNGEYALNATLTADIDLQNESWGNGIGYTLPATGPGTAYTGTFDGKGYTITNVNVSGTWNGFFGDIWSGGIVRNLRIYGSVSGSEVGFVSKNYGTIENCAVYLNITATGNCNGGIAGVNNGTIRNCIYGGQISQSYESGAIAGWQASTVTNCYYVTQDSGVTGDSGVQKTPEEMASGEVTWLLNGSSSEGSWKQTIGTDSFPNFRGQTVYQKPDGTFSNDLTEKAPTPTFTTSQTASSITVNLTNYQEEYGEVQYQWDNGAWGTNGTLNNQRANQAHTVSVRYMGEGNYTQSDTATVSSILTNAASYTVTIPQTTLTAGESSSKAAISVNLQETFDLGANGKVEVNVQNNSSMSSDGKLTLTRQEDPEKKTVTSAMYVDGAAFTDISEAVAVFDRSNYQTQSREVSFAKPTESTIPAGVYSGTITFEISYSEP